MINEFCMEMEVGEARPLSFFSSLCSAAPSFFFCGDFPLLSLVVSLVGLLVGLLALVPKVYLPALVGEASLAMVPCFWREFLRPGDSACLMLDNSTAASFSEESPMQVNFLVAKS